MNFIPSTSRTFSIWLEGFRTRYIHMYKAGAYETICDYFESRYFNFCHSLRIYVYLLDGLQKTRFTESKLINCSKLFWKA